jgi:hypothetical protein
MNVEWIVFLHVLGAMTAGFYLALPFIIRSNDAVLQAALKLNRVGQFALVAQFLSGGYLLSGLGKHFSFGWMGAVGGVFLLMGAFSGMLAGPLRRGDATKAKSRAVVLAILTVIIIFLMYVPELFSSIAYR